MPLPAMSNAKLAAVPLSVRALMRKWPPLASASFTRCHPEPKPICGSVSSKQFTVGGATHAPLPDVALSTRPETLTL